MVGSAHANRSRVAEAISGWRVRLCETQRELWDDPEVRRGGGGEEEGRGGEVLRIESL
jgi:hypothetical protein